DVANHAGGADELSAIARRAAMHLDPPRALVAGEIADLLAVELEGSTGEGPTLLEARVPIVGMDEIDLRAAERLLWGKPGDLPPGGIEERPPAVGIGPEDDFVDIRDDRPVALLAFAKRRRRRELGANPVVRHRS